MKKVFILSVLFILCINSSGQVKVDSTNSNTYSYQYKNLNFSNKVDSVLTEIVNHSSHCDFYLKSSMVYFVSCFKKIGFYYFFIRPYHINKLPELGEYNFFGASKIRNEIFLFRGEIDSSFYKEKCNVFKIYSPLNTDNKIENDMILCDGCLWKTQIIINNQTILIEAEICK
ncbi:MAG TPA: hypothetical protein PKI01_00220 [Bacteroidales bacterium]|nr:hypothetical protein [Bacteroidales bacterium]